MSYLIRYFKVNCWLSYQYLLKMASFSRHNMTRFLLISALISLFSPFESGAQRRDLMLPKGLKKVEIPFEYENNFIIVRIVLNDIFPLRFIFDTGAEHTILTRREITDLLQVDYKRRFPLLGSDLKMELYAYLANGIRIKMNDLYVTNQAILVLEEDYLRFEEFAGINVQGILGADLLRRFVVKIDYRIRKITLYDPAHFQAPKGEYVEMPLEIKRHKPYLIAHTRLGSEDSTEVKLLMDSGANLALMLHTNTNTKLHLPAHVVRSSIGMGLGGTIEGFMGRIPRLGLAGFSFESVTTNFQELSPDMDSSYLNNRNGILGNQILSRFTIIIDYVRSKLYLLPNRAFKDKFQYDKSGMLLAVSGPNLGSFVILNVVPGSPAEEAGLKVGDEIKTLNGLPAALFTLEGIAHKMQGRTGKKIHLNIKREEEKLKVTFKLRDLI